MSWKGRAPTGDTGTACTLWLCQRLSHPVGINEVGLLSYKHLLQIRMQTIQSPNSQRQWGENTIEQIKNRDHGANTRICFPTPHCRPRRTRSEAHSTSAAAKAETVSFRREQQSAWLSQSLFSRAQRPCKEEHVEAHLGSPRLQVWLCAPPGWGADSCSQFPGGG